MAAEEKGHVKSPATIHDPGGYFKSYGARRGAQSAERGAQSAERRARGARRGDRDRLQELWRVMEERGERKPRNP